MFANETRRFNSVDNCFILEIIIHYFNPNYVYQTYCNLYELNTVKVDPWYQKIINWFKSPITTTSDPVLIGSFYINGPINLNVFTQLLINVDPIKYAFDNNIIVNEIIDDLKDADPTGFSSNSLVSFLNKYQYEEEITSQADVDRHQTLLKCLNTTNRSDLTDSYIDCEHELM